ncbi:MAG: hypothetical protein Q4B26_00060 [Eubacteriales bacterium]|nr:hypothetical protein [Eubacteriales bacterium]
MKKREYKEKEVKSKKTRDEGSALSEMIRQNLQTLEDQEFILQIPLRKEVTAHDSDQ